MSKQRNFIVVIIGAGVGFIAGILSAPSSGRRTRAKLKRSARRAVSEAEDGLKDLHRYLNEQISELGDAAGELKGKTKDGALTLRRNAEELRKKAKVMLSDLHDGLEDNGELEQILRDGEALRKKIAKLLDK